MGCPIARSHQPLELCLLLNHTNTLMYPRLFILQPTHCSTSLSNTNEYTAPTPEMCWDKKGSFITFFPHAVPFRPFIHLRRQRESEHLDGGDKLLLRSGKVSFCSLICFVSFLFITINTGGNWKVWEAKGHLNKQEKYYGFIFEKEVVFHQGVGMTQQGELKLYVCTHCSKAIGKDHCSVHKNNCTKLFVTFSKWGNHCRGW